MQAINRGIKLKEMANIANFNPSKVTTGRLKPELQAIFDELPGIIDYCERNGQILSEQIIEEIKDEISLTPERREQVIIAHRDKFAERYKELINSGLRLKADDKEDILETIGLLMFAKGTWELPMPKNCDFDSIKPDPKGYFHAMIAPVFNNYAFIQACNVLLSHTDVNGTQPKGIQCIKRIKLEDLKFIFSKLTESGMLDKSVTEANFVTTFQAGALPDGWKPNKWKGSNPELATLVNQLTELRPLPSLVNQYFKPATIFDSQKTRDINNKRIIELVAAALK